MSIHGIAINADASVIDGSLAVLRRELDYYQELGFTHVELAPHGVGAIYCGKLDRNRVREVKSLLAQYPFHYTVHGSNSVNLMSDDAVDRRCFSAGLEFTAAIGAEIMVYHAGRYIAEGDFLLAPQPGITLGEREALWNQECTSLYEMGQVAVKYGVMIAVENARPYLNAPHYCYAEVLAELARMIQEVNHSQVGITLDAGHAYLAACYYGYDLSQGILLMAPYVRHIHLHDNFGRCCASWERKQYEMAAMGLGDMHMPIGWGDVPANKILALLPQYDGIVTLELRPRYHEHCHEALVNAQALVKGITGAV